MMKIHFIIITEEKIEKTEIFDLKIASEKNFYSSAINIPVSLGTAKRVTNRSHLHKNS